MNIKVAVLVVVVFSIFLVGCSSSQQSGYAAYNQQQGQGQPQGGQYVGGGCGVAPSGDYESTPVDALSSANSAL